MEGILATSGHPLMFVSKCVASSTHSSSLLSSSIFLATKHKLQIKEALFVLSGRGVAFFNKLLHRHASPIP